ncbi:MAG TPA: amidohydrolase family protein [Candidatus Dormibacteraeota bacterium]|nr:amidohydrolase family protein [Candidatus Dormibacteraeota bacterium]
MSSDSGPIIDIHIHIQPLHMFNPHALALIQKGRKDYREVEKYSTDANAFLQFLDDAGIERAGLINYVSPDVIGFPPAVNDWIANYCSADPKRLLAFGSVHPKYVPDAGAEVDRLAKLGIRGLKVHPSHQLFAPNAYRDGFGPLAAMYERAQAHGMPVMIHTGTSIFQGARNVYAQPILADDVAVDFPKLVIILAHGGRPLWMNEAFFLVRRHPNVYMDISGIPPQRLMESFPRIEEIAGKVLWGTDWPGPGVPAIRGNVEKFRALPISVEAQRKILYDNAARLFPPRA